MSCGSKDITLTSQSNDYKILSAYNELKKIYKSPIIVSDTILNIDIADFSHKIAKNNTDTGKVLDSLINIQDNYTNYKYPVKNILKNLNQSGKFKFYFSKPMDDHIMVEVFKTEKNQSHEELTFFGVSDIFLFYFKEKNIINKYQIEMNYN